MSGDENSGLDSLYFGGGPSKKQQTLGANKSGHIQAANKQQAHQQHQQVNQQQSYRKQQQQQQHQYQIDNNNNIMDNQQQYAMNMHQNKFKKETYEAPATDYSTQNNPLNFNSLMEMANNQAAKFPTGSSAYHVAPTYYRENGPVQQQQPQYQVPTANSIVNSSSKKSSSSLSTSSMKINKISNNNNDYENSSSSCSPPKFISNILQQQQQQHHQKQIHHHQPYQNEAYQQQPQSQPYMMSGHLHQKSTGGQYQQYQQQSQAQSYQHQPVHGKQGSSSSNELALKSGSTAASSRHNNHGYMEVEGMDSNPQSSGVNQSDYYDRDEPENLAMNRSKPSGSENGFSRNEDNDETARNDMNKVPSNSNMDMAGSNASTINQISKHIYNFTQVC